MAASNGYGVPTYHDISNTNPSAATLLDHSASRDQSDTNSTPAKEDVTIQCIEHQPKRSVRLHFRDWYWEVAAAVLSLGCIVAVIVVLKTYEWKSLSTWHFYHDITLNTLVALLSTLSRTALIVPVASCIGQLKWIHLVSSPRPLHEFQILDEASRGPWGSLTLIWRLHFKTKLATWGAFITIVSLTMGPLSQQLLSYPSRLHYETSGATFYKTQIHHAGGDGKRGTTDLKMEGAILNGIYDLSAPVQYQCDTGSCEWDDFTTLAVASNCKNVTSGTNITCGAANIDDHTLCNYTTPSGLKLQSLKYNQMEGIGFNLTARRGMSSASGGTLHDTLLEFAAARSKAPYTQQNPDITECTLRWVARHVQNTSVVNGNFRLGVVTDYNLVPASQLFDSEGRVVFNVTDASAPITPKNSSFRAVGNDHVNLETYLAEVFSSTEHDIFHLVLSETANLTQMLQRISDSMSYRLGHSANSTELPGRTITTEQYIRVNWGWIVLPISEVAMGIAFLAATMLHSWRKGVVAWKSSAIIPLFTEMEPGWRTGESGAVAARELEKSVKGMTGVLETKADGGQVFRRTS